MNNSNSILPLTSGVDYEFLDSGNQRKLERFGALTLIRPEVEATWKPLLTEKEWNKADWLFKEEKGKTGKWKNLTNAPEEWEMHFEHLGIKINFDLKLTAFKHIGIFPEQGENWKYIQEQLQQIAGEKKVLNLFAYTGAASIVAAASGATVTNVDSVKQVLNWGRANAAKNKIDSIRWILEDARKFVDKSVRRGDQYHGIIMDPPAFGYGTKNEKWKLEKDLKPLLEQSVRLLDPKQHFFILNTYSPRLLQPQLKAILREIKGFSRAYELKTLGLKSSKGQFLGLGNLVRYTK